MLEMYTGYKDIRRISAGYQRSFVPWVSYELTVPEVHLKDIKRKLTKFQLNLTD